MAEGHRSVQATGAVVALPGAKLSAVQCSSVAGATVVLYDAASAIGAPIYEKEVAANESSFDELPDLELVVGVWAVVTGTCNVVVLLN